MNCSTAEFFELGLGSPLLNLDEVFWSSLCFGCFEKLLELFLPRRRFLRSFPRVGWFIAWFWKVARLVKKLFLLTGKMGYLFSRVAEELLEK
jgi:hypothetical protein